MHMLNFTSQLFITINLFLQCLAALPHSQLGCRGLQIHYMLQWLPRQTGGVTCHTSHSTEISVLCTALCHFTTVLVFALAKSHARMVKFSDGCRENLAARGNPSPNLRALLHSAGQVTRGALTSGFPQL